MTVANTFAPPGFAERVQRLAIGVEVRDALAGTRFAHPLVVLDEARPAPLHTWRRWPPGVLLDDALAPLPRHRTGRFARTYHDGQPTALTLRISEPRPAGRQLVPRRIRVELDDEQTVIDAESLGGTGHPLWRRVFRVGVHPGAGAVLPAGASVVRGRVIRADAAGALHPVRWVRVSATDDLGHEVGWAHGDDRGEFVLLVTPAVDAAAVPPDPQPLELTVTVPAAVPLDPVDRLVPTLDPLHDLPIQELVAAENAAETTPFTGREHWPTTEFGPFPVPAPLRRATGAVIELPT